MNRQMAAAILEHYMPKRNIHNKNKVDYLAYATAINSLRREDALIDTVLEIIDEESTRNGLNLKQTAEIRRRVVELKEVNKNEGSGQST